MKKTLWVVILVLLVVFSTKDCFAAPCYGTKMPKEKKFFWGLQSYLVFDRDLEENFGSMRSTQYFSMLSYGVLDWLSIDLKIGLGNIKQHPVNVTEIDYPSSFAGGYGFRIKLFESEKIKSVFGFQHISVHPHSTHVNTTKHIAILDDWQFSLLISRECVGFTPYIGTRWSRMDYIHRESTMRKRRMSDLTKDIGFIVGVDIPINETIWINIEGSFVDADAVAGSINFKF